MNPTDKTIEIVHHHIGGLIMLTGDVWDPAIGSYVLGLNSSGGVLLNVQKFWRDDSEARARSGSVARPGLYYDKLISSSGNKLLITCLLEGAVCNILTEVLNIKFIVQDEKSAKILTFKEYSCYCGY